MANYATLKAALDAAIYTNTQRAITGDILNAKMDEMINALGAGYQYMGEATPDTNPGSPDSNVVYLATTAGTYTNFGGLTLASGKIAFLRWNGSWAKDDISVQAELTIDSQPTSGSGNPVASGGVFTALSGKQQTIDTVNVSVDNNSGSPSATASVSGNTMTMAFHNIKGAKGDTGATGATGATGPQGPKGDQGNPGSSVDYAFTLANNLTTTDSTVALAAPQGKVLDDKIASIRLGKADDGYIYIYVGGIQQGYGFDPATGDIVAPTIYGDVVVQQSNIEVAHGGTATISVKLSQQPSANQTVAIISNSQYLTLSAATLTFTEGNWDTWQIVTITNSFNDLGKIDSSIIIRNSDIYFTETSIPITIYGISYEDLVDTTIPSGAHVLEPSDFDAIYEITGGISLRNYNGSYTNVIVPATMTYNGVTKRVNLATEYAFYHNTTIQYVTIEDGVGADEYGRSVNNRNWQSLFNGCTSLIGVKYEGSDLTNIRAFGGCTSLKFFDGLDKQTLNTTLYTAFQNCSSLDYLPDMSKLTAVTGLQQAFDGCSSLKRVFGLPKTLSGTTISANSMYKNCALLEYAEIPDGCSDLYYAFQNCRSLRKVDIYTEQTVTRISGIFDGCSNLYAYCVPESDAYTKLFAQYSSSTSIHIVEMGGSELPSIVTWGDSLTSPSVAWKEWPKRLQEMLGDTAFAVKNEAVSGETTISTSARQGGNAISVAAFTIPATTDEVAVTMSTVDGHTFGSGQPFTAGGSFNPCTVGGVDGYIVKRGDVYNFKRKEAGSQATSVTADSPLVSDSDSFVNNEDAIMLMIMGNNAGWDVTPQKLLNQVQSMVNHFTANGGTKYIIAGPMSGQYMRSTADVNKVLAYEALAAEQFGSHWLNLRQYLITYGLTQNNLTASDTDIERMAENKVPGSLLGGGSTSNIVMYPSTSSDDSHPNAYGANSMALAFFEKGIDLGYWTAPNNG